MLRGSPGIPVVFCCLQFLSTTVSQVSGATCPALTPSSGATVKYNLASNISAPYNENTTAQVICPCLQTWPTNARRTEPATCTSAGTWTTNSTSQTCAALSATTPVLTTSTGRKLHVLSASGSAWTRVTDAADECTTSGKGSLAVGLSSGEIGELEVALGWRDYGCPGIQSLVYMPGTFVEGRIPADFSRGCKEVYLDTDGFVKTRDRKCSFSSGELAKLGVVCQSGIPLSCPDSIPYAGLEVKEAARNIPSGTAVAGNTITFKCDRCVKTFKNFPDENEIVSKCYANAGWFPYKSLIGDCKLPCNGTIPVVKNSDENCAVGSATASGKFIMTMSCPSGQNFGGSTETSFTVVCGEQTVTTITLTSTTISGSTGSTAAGTTGSTAKSTSAGTTVSTTAGTTGSTTASTTVSTTVGTTGSTAAGTAGSTTVGTTGSTAAGTAGSTTGSTTTGTTGSTTGGTTGSTTGSTTAGTTGSTTTGTTGSTTGSTTTGTGSTTGGTTGSTTVGTTQSTTTGTTGSTTGGTTGSTTTGTTGSTNTGTTGSTTTGTSGSTTGGTTGSTTTGTTGSTTTGTTGSTATGTTVTTTTITIGTVKTTVAGTTGTSTAAAVTTGGATTTTTRAPTTVASAKQLVLIISNNGASYSSCEKLCSADPPTIDNSSNDWDGKVKTAKTVVEYTCKSGFAFSKSGEAYLRPVTSTCLASSQTWTIPPQTCEPACSANLTVVNDTTTDFSGERFINSTVTYICKPGYTYNESDPLDTKRSIMCQSDKTWQTWDKKNKCVPQPPIRLTSGSNNGDCAAVSWKNPIALVYDRQIPFFITGAEDRARVCRGKSLDPNVTGYYPGFMFFDTDLTTQTTTKFCAISHPHPNATGTQVKTNPDFEYLVEQFETVITWESVTFKGKNISDFPKCALPVSPADPNLLIGRQMICDSKGMSCTNVVGGAHVNYGFRPADKSGQAVIDDTVNIDTFEVLVAKKKKPTNPFKQMWSIFLPSAGILGFSILMCICLMHEKNPCCKSTANGYKKASRA